MGEGRTRAGRSNEPGSYTQLCICAEVAALGDVGEFAASSVKLTIARARVLTHDDDVSTAELRRTRLRFGFCLMLAAGIAPACSNATHGTKLVQPSLAPATPSLAVDAQLQTPQAALKAAPDPIDALEYSSPHASLLAEYHRSPPVRPSKMNDYLPSVRRDDPHAIRFALSGPVSAAPIDGAGSLRAAEAVRDEINRCHIHAEQHAPSRGGSLLLAVLHQGKGGLAQRVEIRQSELDSSYLDLCIRSVFNRIAWPRTGDGERAWSLFALELSPTWDAYEKSRVSHLRL